MNRYPTEAIDVFSFGVCVISLLVLFRFWGQIGLTVYGVVAFIAANLQVLKAGHYQFFDHPVALGTLVFSSIFLSMDMLTEYYGPQAAKRAIFLSFFSFLLLTCWMMLTLGVAPLEGTEPEKGAYLSFHKAHQALSILFVPAPSLFIASLCAYVFGQYTDIWIYQGIKRLTGANHRLWLRTALSQLIGGLLDNTVFSVLAWVVFAPTPVDIQTLFYTYILGSYLLRLVGALANVPVMYLSRFVVPRGITLGISSSRNPLP